MCDTGHAAASCPESPVAIEDMMNALRKRQPDRRIRRTRALLHEALTSLIREKPYEGISVKDVLKRADVGRSTFYAHFHSKDELLVSGIGEMLRGAYAQPTAQGMKGDGFTRFSLPLFEHIQQHRVASGVRSDASVWATAHEHLRRIMADVIARELKKDSRQRRPGAQGIPPDLFAQHVASTFLVVLDWWVRSKSPLPPRELNELFQKLTVPANVEAPFTS
jgi:AcrR family transcriptional regulator